VCVESFVKGLRVCVVVWCECSFRASRAAYYVKWTGHEEVNYCQKGGYRVVGRVVIIRWHQAWRGKRRRRGRVKKNRQKTNTTALNLTHLLKKKRRGLSGHRPTYLQALHCTTAGRQLGISEGLAKRHIALRQQWSRRRCAR